MLIAYKQIRGFYMVFNLHALTFKTLGNKSRNVLLSRVVQMVMLYLASSDGGNAMTQNCDNCIFRQNS